MSRVNPERIELLQTKANLLRVHSIRMTTRAGSGHPTTCMSSADLVSALFFEVLRYDVPNPRNPLNDRVIFSKGHAAPLLYAVWAEAGAFLVEHLDTLRQFDSDLEGHPTPRFTWYGAATGSLGQGLSIASGMALGLKRDGIPARVFCLMGDGETAEGAVWEACAFASYYGLNNLIAIVDVNRLGQSQPTMLQHDLDTYAQRFRAFGWEVLEVQRWGKKRLAYEIKKRQYGYYVHIRFATAKGSIVRALEREYQLNEAILRYLTIVLDKQALKAEAQRKEKMGAAAATAPVTAGAPVEEVTAEVEEGAEGAVTAEPEQAPEGPPSEEA